LIITKPEEGHVSLQPHTISVRVLQRKTE
jgi:hypothetical protein